MVQQITLLIDCLAVDRNRTVVQYGSFLDRCLQDIGLFFLEPDVCAIRQIQHNVLVGDDCHRVFIPGILEGNPGKDLPFAQQDPFLYIVP